MRKFIALLVTLAALVAPAASNACSYGRNFSGWRVQQQGWQRQNPTSNFVQATITPEALIFRGEGASDDTFSSWVMKQTASGDAYVQVGVLYQDVGFQYPGFYLFVQYSYDGGATHTDELAGPITFGPSHLFKLQQLTDGTQREQPYVDGNPFGPPIWPAPLHPYTIYDFASEEQTYDPPNTTCMTQQVKFTGTSFTSSVATQFAEPPYHETALTSNSFRTSGP